MSLTILLAVGAASGAAVVVSSLRFSKWVMQKEKDEAAKDAADEAARQEEENKYSKLLLLSSRGEVEVCPMCGHAREESGTCATYNGVLDWMSKGNSLATIQEQARKQKLRGPTGGMNVHVAGEERLVQMCLQCGGSWLVHTTVPMPDEKR